MLLFSYLNDHQAWPKRPKTHTKAQTWSQKLTTSFPLAFLMQPPYLQKWHQLCCPDSIKANCSNWALKSPALVSFREPSFQWLNYTSFIRKWQSVKQKLTTQRASCYAATWNSRVFFQEENPTFCLKFRGGYSENVKAININNLRSRCDEIKEITETNHEQTQIVYFVTALVQNNRTA